MSLHQMARLSCGFVLWAAVYLPAATFAADPLDASAPAAPSSFTANDGADFFAAIRNGDLDVKFIPRDSRRAQVIIKNTTDQPLTVKLPDAFVGMPVLAQLGGAGGAGNRTTGTNTNKQNQGVGGGMGGGAVGGAFSVPPEKVVKLQVDVVCLDYGKPEPSAHVPYTIVPAEQYTKSPEVRELCRMLGEGKLNQRVAQIAAWHLANHLSWDELANLKTFPHFPQYSQAIFTADEIHEAMGAVTEAIKLADERKPSTAAPAFSSTPSAANQ